MKRTQFRRWVAFGAIALLVCPTVLWAVGETTDTLRVWLVFNLPAASVDVPLPPVDDVIRRWDRVGIDLRSLRDKAQSNPGFLRQLLGQQVILEQLQAFRREQPDFPRIELHFYGWDDYWETLRSTPKARQPDLVQVPSSWCSSLAAGLGVLAPLNDAQAAQAAADFDPALLSPCRVNNEGPSYGVPWLVDVRVLFFWRDALPDLENNLQTYASAKDAFRATLRSSSPRLPYPAFALPTARDWELLHEFSLFVWGAGGELVSRRGVPGFRWNQAAFQEPALEMAEYVLGLEKDGLLVLPRDTRQALEQQFGRHQIGSILSGPWLLDQLPAGSVPLVGMVLPPVYDGTPVTFAGGSLLAMTDRAPALREPAWRLARHLSVGAAALPIALAAGLIPASGRARGSAAEALARREALEQGATCETYFACLLARTRVDQFVTALDRALHVSRTLPPLPNWWQLEVPSHLGSLNFFWSELAAQQPRESLIISLGLIGSEWNDVLERPVRTAEWVAGLVLFMIAVGVVLRHHQRRTKARGAAEIAEAHRLEQYARDREATIEEQFERLRRDVMLHEKDATLLQEVKQILLASDRARTPTATVSGRFVITLPSAQWEKLTIERHGQRTSPKEPQAGRLIEYVVRQSLLHQRPVHFSIVSAALCLWAGPDAPLKAPRLEVIVAGMRRAFDSKVGDVFTKARSTVYAFMLRETEYQCGIVLSREEGRVSDFVTEVRTPFVEAVRQQITDPAAAFALSLRALAAERTLADKDIEVLVLVCELSGRAGSPLTPESQGAVERARQELDQAAYVFRSFFDTYDGLGDLLQRAGVSTERRELVEEWERIRATWTRIQAVMTNMESPAVPPRDIEDDWLEAARLFPSIEAHAIREGVAYTSGATTGDDRDLESFNAAFERILSYSGRAIATPVVRRARASIDLFDVDEKTRAKVEKWVEIRTLTSLANTMHEGLRARRFPDHAGTTARIDAALVDALRTELRQHASHVVLDLWPTAIARDQLRSLLLAGQWRSDFGSCLSEAYRASRNPPAH